MSWGGCLRTRERWTLREKSLSSLFRVCGVGFGVCYFDILSFIVCLPGKYLEVGPSGRKVGFIVVSYA